MVNINDMFPSKYLKAPDLQGELVKVKIREAAIEELSSERKIVLYFAGKEKGLVMNRTNADTVASAFGTDTDDWLGKIIELFATPVPYNGRMVDGIRIRIPKLTQPRKQEADNGWTDNDENPAPKEARTSGGGRAADLDDEIPFAPERR